MAGILVVDDSPTKAHKMVNTFVRVGHQVLTAMTASDGVKVASKDQETDKVWGERQGASCYLIKPVDVRTLISTVSGLLE